MTPRNELIHSIRNAITELEVRIEEPTTSPAERAQLKARVAQFEADLAQLMGHRIAEAAGGAAVRPPDDATFENMRSAARDLDDAIATNKATSAIVALVNTGFAALQAS